MNVTDTGDSNAIPQAAPQTQFYSRALAERRFHSDLVAWLVLYVFSNPSTHLGSFFGNAIADWSGVVVTILATKYLYEKDSAESLPCPKASHPLTPAVEFLREHSLSIFLLITGIGWVVSFHSHGPRRKMGPSRRQHRF